MRFPAAVLLAALALGGCGSALPAGPAIPSALPGTAAGALVPTAAHLPALEARAAAGLAHVLFAKSPGGLPATIARAESFRAPIARAVAGPCGGASADELESIVILESAGRPDVLAGGSVSDAAGLTQIVASTATGLLGLHLDLGASARLTRELAATADPRRAARLRARRARADPRFDPAQALAATCRYLTVARTALGRTDLAEESYHMGIGNLQTALRRFGASAPIPYGELYFGSSPAEHASAYAWLSGLGDDSPTYLWRLRAAQAALGLARSNPAALARESDLQTATDSAELALHPPCCTPAFATPDALARAEGSGELVGLPLAALRGGGITPARALTALGGRYEALRPDALAVLGWIGRIVSTLAHDGPLELTAAARDGVLQARLAAADPALTPSGYTTDITGYSFALARRYRSPAQALALQFALDRLTALDLVAWVRSPSSIRVTVAGGAARALR